jgi:hypothetical protein
MNRIFPVLFLGRAHVQESVAGLSELVAVHVIFLGPMSIISIEIVFSFQVCYESTPATRGRLCLFPSEV